MVRAVSSCPTTAPGSGLLRSLVFTALVVAMGWVFLHLVSPEPGAEMAVLSVGSGEGYAAADIVRAASLLHKEKGLRIDFVGHREKGRILVFREKDWDCLGCGCVVRIGVEQIALDDENLSLSEIAKRFKIYAESARLTDSMPIIRVTASDGVPGERLVEVLEVLHQTGIRHITVPSDRDPETESTRGLSPQIQGQPYRVELR